MAADRPDCAEDGDCVEGSRCMDGDCVALEREEGKRVVGGGGEEGCEEEEQVRRLATNERDQQQEQQQQQQQLEENQEVSERLPSELVVETQKREEEVEPSLQGEGDPTKDECDDEGLRCHCDADCDVGQRCLVGLERCFHVSVIRAIQGGCSKTDNV